MMSAESNFLTLASPDKCQSDCGCHASANLGKSSEKHDYVIALAGNPNTGKSTIFNALTGLRQHVGNWAGKTVVRAEGYFGYHDKNYKLVDLPGTYSLLSTSPDEEIARDFVLFGKPDVTIVVLDATRIERNLHLVLQILEITNRAVVALNLIDEARRNGIKINEKSLSKDLGVPVVPLSARRGEGISDLLAAIESVAQNTAQTYPHRIKYSDETLENAVEILANQLNKTFENLSNARWVALRLLEGDESIIEAVRRNKLGRMTDNHGAPEFPLVA